MATRNESVKLALEQARWAGFSLEDATKAIEHPLRPALAEKEIGERLADAEAELKLALSAVRAARKARG